MMVRIIFSLIVLLSCKPAKKPGTGKLISFMSDAELRRYIKSPENIDTLCILQLKEAQNDFTEGKLVLRLYSRIRQYNQIVELASIYGISVETENQNCIIYPDQTEFCYKAFMDSVIEMKFGRGFIDALTEKADTLLSESPEPVDFRDCDNKMEAPAYNVILLQIPSRLSDSLESSRWGDKPSMTIEFYTDRSGLASKFNLWYFDDAGVSRNALVRDDLFDYAKSVLEQRTWPVGFVKGKRVISRNNVTVKFE